MPHRPMRAPSLLAAALLATATVGCHEPTSPGNAAVASTITAARVQHWVERLAHDSMLGRDTPSPQLDAAAATIAAYLRQLGLRPVFPGGGYVQRYPTPPADSASPDSAPNVAALLPGSDPQLSDQYVVLVAHMDGSGIVAPVGTDSICNAADDNASGTAGVLELAAAFARTDPRPRRPLLFILVSGEERKYWGSQWYVDHPAIPLASVVGVVNLDMIGRNGRDSVKVGGVSFSTMGYTFTTALAAHPELGFKVASPGPQSGSDFVPFWVEGIPWLHFFTGLHADYHRPSDEPAHLDPDKAARVTRLAFHTTLMVANADARPEWLPSPAAVHPAPR